MILNLSFKLHNRCRYESIECIYIWLKWYYIYTSKHLIKVDGVKVRILMSNKVPLQVTLELDTIILKRKNELRLSLAKNG